MRSQSVQSLLPHQRGALQRTQQCRTARSIHSILSYARPHLNARSPGIPRRLPQKAARRAESRGHDTPRAVMSPCDSKVKVLFFASCREMAGRKETSIQLPGDTSSTSTLRKSIVEQLPGLKPVAATVTLAVNQEYVSPDEDAPLKDGDEVAFIPPISGG